MTASDGDTASAGPVERFKPTTGVLSGWIGLVFVAVGIAYVALEVHTKTGLQVALGLAFLGMVIWVTQLRSRAAAYPSTLLLKNSLVDIRVPLRLVDEVSATRTLNVWVGERRYVCIGIGRSMKSMFKSERASSQSLGFSKLHQYTETASSPDQRAMTYETFVTNRIQELADRAKKSSTEEPAPEVRRLPAWPEIVVLVVTGTAFVATLFL